MTFDLIFRSKADYDLDDIKAYYDNISTDLTNRFFIEFYKVIEYIKQEPSLFQVRYDDIHTATLHRFPYSIHYQVKKDTVIILRVLHSSRYFE